MMCLVYAHWFWNFYTLEFWKNLGIIFNNEGIYVIVYSIIKRILSFKEFNILLDWWKLFPSLGRAINDIWLYSWSCDALMNYLKISVWISGEAIWWKKSHLSLSTPPLPPQQIPIVYPILTLIIYKSRY